MKRCLLLSAVFLFYMLISNERGLAQNKLNNKATPEAYGAKGNGVADDTKALRDCFAKNKVVKLSGEYLVSGTIDIASDQQIYSENARIKYAGSDVLLRSGDCSDWQIAGKLTISGTGMKEGKASAIFIEGGKNIDISGLTVQDFQGTALTLKQGKKFQRGNCLRLSNSLVTACWTGVYVYPQSEYHSVSGVNVIGCHSAVEIRGGNVTWTGGNIGDNVHGLFIGGSYGSNNSHGIFQGVNINHNTEYNLRCDSVELGQTFSGCHIYGEKDKSIIINESRAVSFVGGTIDGRVAIAGSAENQHHYFNAVQLEPYFNLAPAFKNVYFNNCFTRIGGPYQPETPSGK